MALLLGIDLGTSYFKVGLWDERGIQKGLGRVRVDKLVPRPGWAELPVARFWELLREGLAEALQQAKAAPADIMAMSYSSQANTFLLLDERDAPLTPLVFWNDLRVEAVPEPFAGFSNSEAFQQATGFRGVARESAVCKWAWFRRHEPALWSRARRVLTLSDYFTFALTGEPVGDASTAALLGIYELAKRRWWPDALDAFGIESRRLSTPLLPGSRCGRTCFAATALLGVPAAIDFAVGGLDHHVAAIGAGLGGAVDASISTGTVLAAIGLVDERVFASGCFHGPHVGGVQAYRLAFDPAGAGQLEEFQRRFAPACTIEQLIAEAAYLPPDSRAVAEPWTDRWGADRARAVRTILDSIAYAHRKLLSAVAQGGAPRLVAATGGGARSAEWLQITADVLGVTLMTPASAERACLGAAALASVAAGIHRDIKEACGAMVRFDRSFAPENASARRD